MDAHHWPRLLLQIVQFGMNEKVGQISERNACLPGCIWNATPRSLSPLERNIGFWTQA